MITLHNNNYDKPDFNAAYQELFARGYQLLVEKNVLPSDAKMFTGLDDYFAHIGDLIALDPIFAMLPLDEEPFKINANTRDITIPSSFKCVGVQNDNLCEIITFTVDRYFDYVDLNTTEIAIQWKNINNVEGIHYVGDFKDIKTYPGKIRFGWPLSANVTEVPGDIVFSVRFFIRSENGNGPVKYILNTLPAKFTIKSTLNVVEANAIKENDITDLFKEFVQNSAHPSGERPLSPSFGLPGLNLDTYGALNSDDTLILKAQAIKGDNGNLSYHWFYKRSDSGEKDPYVEITSGDIYEIDNDVYEKVLWDQDSEGNVIKRRVAGEEYFTYNPDGAVAYPPYTQAVFNEETPDLYERYTTLTIKPSAEKAFITGDYFVRANNEVSGNVAHYDSRHCNVPAPGDAVVDVELPPHIFLDSTKTLNFGLKADPTEPNYTFTWKKRGTEDALQYYNGKQRETTLNVNDFGVGHYHVDYKVDLNRTEHSDSSTECKVTYLPVAPEFTELIQNDGALIDITTQEEIPTYNTGKEIILTVKTNLDDANEYQSEGLSYQWYIQVNDEDKDFVPIVGSHLQAGYVKALSDTNTITVITPMSVEGAYVVKCLVTNTIQDKTATNDSGSKEVFTIKWKKETESTEEV